MAEYGLTKNQIITELSRSPHGKLEEYVKVGKEAATQEPEFFAHLIAYDRVKGQIRDAKVALPVISLSVPTFPEEFKDNSWAHIASLGPRELERAFRFAMSLGISRRKLRKLVSQYLDKLELNRGKWDGMALQHKNTLANLYALAHAKRSDRVGGILFEGKYPAGSAFEAVKQLASMTPQEAAGTILEKNIPFLVAQGALGKKIAEPDLILALMKRMSPVQFITNVKMLEKLNVKSNPALRGAFDEAMERASKSTKNVLKTTRAAENVNDADLKAKLSGLQERQLSNMKGVEGNWLVLGDKSTSMSASIDTSCLVAATLAKMVKGKVQLAFFDTVVARAFDVSGKTYEEIKSDTKWVKADGNTSIGCGMQWAIDKKLEVDGIAIVSDGGENTPPIFAAAYMRYSQILGKEVPVYFYQLAGDTPVLIENMKRASQDLQVFDIRSGVDFYSLPNLVQTMRTQRYGLVEEILDFKLLSLDTVFAQLNQAEADAELLATV